MFHFGVSMYDCMNNRSTCGSYPSFYLSSLNPVRVLKGKLQFTQGSVLFRKSLTVFQFVLSIVLIISTIVITRQIYFIQNSHLGKGDGNLLYMRIEGQLANKNKYLLFKNEALQCRAYQWLTAVRKHPTI